MMDTPDIQSSIARGLQRLRKERALSQAELAESLNLSQSRLSKIETGQGSLTAEQLIGLLQKYGLPLGYFVPPERNEKIDEDPFLQNALVNLGAVHLRTVPGVAVPERLEFAETAVLETLFEPVARFITALAPVIARHCESINFHRIAEALKRFKIEYRIWWVVDGTYAAIGERLKDPYLPRDLDRLYQRAFLLLERKKLDVGTVQDQLKDREDELDRDLISERTIQLVKKNRDKSAQNWRIVTRIKKSDFEQALKDTEEK